MILLGTKSPTGEDDKQVICNNLQNHFWSHLRLICAARVRRSSFCNVDHLKHFSADQLKKQKLFSWSTLLEVSEQTARQSRSLWQMLSTNKFSTRNGSLCNEVERLELGPQYWDFLVHHQKNLYTERRPRSGYVGYLGVTEVRGD